METAEERETDNKVEEEKEVKFYHPGAKNKESSADQADQRNHQNDARTALHRWIRVSLA